MLSLDSKQTRGGHIWTKTSSESEVGPQRGRGRRKGLMRRGCSTSGLRVPVPRPPPPPVQSVGPRIMPVRLRPAPPGPGLIQMSETRTFCLPEAVLTLTPTPKPGPRRPPCAPSWPHPGSAGTAPSVRRGALRPCGRGAGPPFTHCSIGRSLWASRASQSRSSWVQGPGWSRAWRPEAGQGQGPREARGH